MISGDACCLLPALQWQSMHWYSDTGKVRFGGCSIRYLVLIRLGDFAKVDLRSYVSLHISGAGGICVSPKRRSITPLP
jgi:hypothetical protein